MILVDVRRELGVGTKVVEDIIKDGRRIVWMVGDRSRCDLVDCLVVKDVEAGSDRIESGDESAEANERS